MPLFKDFILAPPRRLEKLLKVHALILMNTFQTLPSGADAKFQESKEKKQRERQMEGEVCIKKDTKPVME